MQIGPFELRPCQIRAFNETRRAIAELKQSGDDPHVLVQAPCGFGKTLLSTAIMKHLQDNKTAAFLVSGRILVFQKSRKMSECELPHSVMMADSYDIVDGVYGRQFSLKNEEEFNRRLVVSKDTLDSRSIRLKDFDVDVIIVDEAHLGMSERWIETIRVGVPVIGLTATPATGKGKGLGDFYKRIVVGATYSELIQDGYLVPAKVFIPYTVELKRKNGEKVKVGNNGEYVLSQVDEVFNQQELIGDCVEKWKELAQGKRTLVYASSVAHAIALAEAFNGQGIRAEHVDATTPQNEREEIYERFRRGDVRVITNFGVLRVGADFPCAEVVQLMVSMNSLNSFLQTVGRGLRTYQDSGYKKAYCIIIDHGGNVIKHGWPTEDRYWPLDPGDEVCRLKPNGEKDKSPPRVSVCPKCKFEKGGRAKCPNPDCGYVYKRSGVMERTVGGTFREITPNQVKEKKQETDLQKIWNSSLGIAAAKNQSVAVALAIFKNKSGLRRLPDELYPQPESHHYRMKVRAVWPGYYKKKAGV